MPKTLQKNMLLTSIDRENFLEIPRRLNDDNLERFLDVVLDTETLFDPTLGDMRRSSQVDEYIELCGAKRLAWMLSEHFKLGPFAGEPDPPKPDVADIDQMLDDYAMGKDIEEVSHGTT